MLPSVSQERPRHLRFAKKVSKCRALTSRKRDKTPPTLFEILKIEDLEWNSLFVRTWNIEKTKKFNVGNLRRSCLLSKHRRAINTWCSAPVSTIFPYPGAAYGNIDNQCRDPMNNDKDCRVGHLTRSFPGRKHWPGGR